MAKIYWRTIMRGTRTFNDVPDNLKDEVKSMAMAEVETGTITSKEYQEITGEAYN